jgi:hypothetical protein
VLFLSKTSEGAVLNPNPGLLTRLILYIGLAVFYAYGLVWCLVKRGSVKSTSDVLRVFYYDFLRLRREHVIVEKMTERELVVVSVNPCPILKLSLLLGVDTRYSCRLISETVCRMVLKCLNPELVFTRDYSYIRPYSSGCRERILLPETTTLSARSPSTGLQ